MSLSEIICDALIKDLELTALTVKDKVKNKSYEQGYIHGLQRAIRNIQELLLEPDNDT